MVSGENIGVSTTGRRISRSGATVMVSMAIHCTIGFNIVPAAMNPLNHKNFYHFGTWVANIIVSTIKTIVKTQDSNVIIHLFNLGCIIPMGIILIGLLSPYASDGIVQGITKKIGLLKECLYHFFCHRQLWEEPIFSNSVTLVQVL